MKMKLKLAFIGAMLAAWASHSSAATYTGNELLADITSNEPTSVIASYRYIQGVVDAESVSYNLDKKKPKSRHYFCLPSEVTGGQVHDLVKLHLQNNPVNRHFPAIFFVMVPLAEAYPAYFSDGGHLVRRRERF